MKNSLLFSVFFLIIIQSNFAQEWSSLLDSINKYKEFDPQKALLYGFKAIEEKDINEISFELYEINFKIGEVYYLSKRYEQAFKFLSRSLAIYELVPIEDRKNKKVKKPPWVLLILGNVYWTNGRYDKSIKLFLESIENFNLIEDDAQKNFGLNTADDGMGMVSLELGDFDQAEKLFKNSLQRRLEFKNKSDILFSYSRLTLLYFITQRVELGTAYLKEAKELYEKSNNNGISQSDLYYSQIIASYASYLESNGQILKALDIYKEAKNIIYDFPQFQKQQVDFSIARCLYKLKRFEEAKKIVLRILRVDQKNVQDKIDDFRLLQKILTAQNMTKELLPINDSLNYYLKEQNQINNIEFSDLETQLILTEKQRELNENRKKYYQSIYLSVTIISLSIIIILLLSYYYNYQKNKTSILELEKKQILLDLESKKMELVSKANFIMQRNEYLKNLNSKINEISSSKIKKEISSLINSEKSYQEFDKIFTQVYPKFYEILKEKHNLSQTYLRLVAYIKMNQNNNEIATLNGVSLRTVETQRYRLTKILNLNDDQDLNSYIKNV